MKSNRSIMASITLFIFSLFLAAGCKYDVAEPQWEKPKEAVPVPAVTQVVPAAAVPGVNTITINGQNFAASPDSNVVYFDNVIADVISNSANSIVVRRPNMVAASATIKVISSKALVVAKYGSYKIDNVVEKYGSFLDNLALASVVVDAEENLYVLESVSKKIIKVTPAGIKSQVAIATRSPIDAKIGPDGAMYITENNRSIDRVDLAAGTVKQWIQLPAGKIARYCDFDAAGYFYTGGTRTDLVVVAPNLTTRSIGVYSNDEILSIRVYNGYLYVASRVLTQPAKIWKHKLDGSGNVGAQELVVDMNATQFSTRIIKAITFSADGTMYIATDSLNPLLILTPGSQNLDYYYKEILPAYCKQFYWGSGNFLYMISGDTAAGVDWTVYKVDAGTKGAPYY